LVDASILSIAFNYGLPTVILLAVGYGVLRFGTWCGNVAFPEYIKTWRSQIEMQGKMVLALKRSTEIIEQHGKLFIELIEYFQKEKPQK
jgi:hypothetical protein